MAYNLEVKYYNTFWLKQVTTPLQKTNSAVAGETLDVFPSVYPGVSYLDYANDNWYNFPQTIPSGLDIKPPYSNVYSTPNNSWDENNGSNWIVEESRIRGGFNNSSVDLGVRAYLMEESNEVRHRSNALVYSGVFNSRTNINRTNVFATGEDITKSVDPHNGSVQLLYAMDNNLTIFQENKVSTALIDKDAIYSAEGTAINTTSNVVIGQVTPYTGEYGISRNPESFASFGFRRYFADKDRSAILRLSRDGITEISQYGMKDFFRDELAKLNDKIELTSAEYAVSTITSGSNSYANQQPQVASYPGTTQVTKPTALGSWIAVSELGPIAPAPAGLPVLGTDTLIVGSLIQVNFTNTKLPTDESAANGFWQNTNAYVTGTGTVGITDISSGTLPYPPTSYTTCLFTDNGPINIEYLTSSGIYPRLRFLYYEKDKIEGGFDNYKDNYVISLQQHSGSKTLDETSDYYSTLTFKENVQGWTTFYSFRPDLMFSLKNNFYTAKDGSLYLHYSPLTSANNFYGVENKSSITFIFNPNPSVNKNFKTINYEGSSGWQVDSFVSDSYAVLPNVSSELDVTNSVKSYEEGAYIENGITYRAGFTIKENKYYANLINNTEPTAGEVVFGSAMTGIKGYYATVKLSTDDTTVPGGIKELFAVSSQFVISSQ